MKNKLLMSIQIATQEALPAATGITYMAFLSSQPPEVVLGAFTGSIIFLLGITNKPKWQWMLLFTVAFMAGLLGASTVASIGSGILHFIGLRKTVFPDGMGSMISAATVVNILIWLRDNPTFFLKKGKESQE